jgi:hypothetical protein
VLFNLVALIELYVNYSSPAVGQDCYLHGETNFSAYHKNISTHKRYVELFNRVVSLVADLDPFPILGMWGKLLVKISIQFSQWK